MPSKNEWQPIETAPKDGTLVLVFDANIQSIKIASWPANGWDGWYTNPGRYTVGNPTHWMSLPEPPDA